MPPSEKTLYNTNVRDFFTYIIEKIDEKRKEAEKIDRRVCCG